MIARDDGRRGRSLELGLVEVATARDAVDVLVLVIGGGLRACRSQGLAFALRELRLSLHPDGKIQDRTLSWRQERSKRTKERASGNFHERERTNSKSARLMKMLPAGVPGRFVQVRHRMAAFLHDAPLLFIGVVIAIAVLFRVTVGAIRSASAEPETSAIGSPVAASKGALHEPSTARSAVGPLSPGAPTSPATTADPTRSETASTTVRAGGPLPRRGHDGSPPRKKPRTHGRR